MLRYSLKQDYTMVSPLEKKRRHDFFENGNVNSVVLDVHSRVDSEISRTTIVESMHCVFTNMLGRNQLLGLNVLNENVVQELIRKKASSDKFSLVSRKVGFESSKIPTNILPRPSFSLEKEDENMGYILFK